MARFSSNFSAKHKSKSSLSYYSGKERLRTLSLKQLQEKSQSAQSGTLKDKIAKEIARKQKMGITWKQPVQAEAE